MLLKLKSIFIITLKNPFYKYKVFYLTLEKEEAIIVLRKISLKNSSVIR